MTSFVSMLRYACMLIFSEVVEYVCMCTAEYCDIYMVMFCFVLIYASMLVFLEVVEYLCMSIAKL
jgi:hypothetical protein